MSDPPEANDPAQAFMSREALEARREQRRKAEARRRRRRRPLWIATPLLVLLVWAVGSYAIWMLRPTSMSLGARSVEWVESRRALREHDRR
jgi:hypothetical protein